MFNSFNNIQHMLVNMWAWACIPKIDESFSWHPLIKCHLYSALNYTIEGLLYVVPHICVIQQQTYTIQKLLKFCKVAYSTIRNIRVKFPLKFDFVWNNKCIDVIWWHCINKYNTGIKYAKLCISCFLKII